MSCDCPGADGACWLLVLGSDISARTGDALGLHCLGSQNQVPRDSGFIPENKVAQKEGALKKIILKYK